MLKRMCLLSAIVISTATLPALADPVPPPDRMPIPAVEYLGQLRLAQQNPPRVCAPGETRCGADGYVYLCGYDGRGWVPAPSNQRCR
jgi:hypothetical protein